MGINRKIRVLIVDDSMVFREVISRGLNTDKFIEVVATAKDPFEARDKIIKYKPDVMTCDIEMPKMNGIEFIKRLLPQYKIPVVVVSSISEAVLDAMKAGAVDFVTKPDIQSVGSVEEFINELVYKVKAASESKIMDVKENHSETITSSDGNSKYKIIAIGASTGGIEAIYSVLKKFPKNMPGIVIVQHIPPVFSKMFAERLNSQIDLEVKEAKTGDYVEKGKVLIAPGNKHMKIKNVGDRFQVKCFDDEKVNGVRPAVDILFESVAKEAGDTAIGIILTGMGYDGAKGLLSMKRKGARTIGQDEKTSVVYGMPKAAFNVGAVEKQAKLENIPEIVMQFTL
ncbi:protein-glutamate methylesterase/protein-glutamine glutaminase [Clostridium paridis]|uniref:Protein-glutamate methylesterase/protein-glutamine glutaminase n=1 Tax=Clostridium paridis TaxID=2803863 RepID=A0A937FJA5_9CLOT|nr:chemotaxis response regulator protein-glutamate methylesterase [Clostridium paridis]MBL4933467.1 chemotaxis response regulator protein-glutamate methylesterase [Clostridium paridis]